MNELDIRNIKEVLEYNRKGFIKQYVKLVQDLRMKI